MKKQILNIGKALNKAEQKQIIGGEKGLDAGCSVPSENVCDPWAGQFHGNPACVFNEVCVLGGPPYPGGICVCPPED